MPAVRLSFQAAKGFKKSVGFHRGRDGTGRKQKVFYLGDDKAVAAFVAQRITEIWRRLAAGGHSVWTDDALAEIEELRREVSRGTVVPTTGSTNGASAGNGELDVITPAISAANAGVTSHEAIEAYRAEIADSPRISDGYRVNLDSILDDLRRNLGDMLLDQVGRSEVLGLVHYYMRRPKSRKTGRPITADTAHNHIRAIKNFFIWLEETDRWHGFRRWERHFKVSQVELMTDDEKDEADDADWSFSTDELATLYRAASDRMKLFMLLALNTAMTQGELATLRRRHMIVMRSTIIRNGQVIQPGEYWITKVRKKVKGKAQRGRWRLWSETYEMAIRHWTYSRNKETNYDERDLMFVTRLGNPLVWYKRGDAQTPGQRLDSVQQAWNRLLDRTPRVTRRPFKHLRKTSSQLVRDIGGKELSELHLVHTDKTMGRAYNKGDYIRLGEVLIEVRKKLLVMFD